MGMRKLVRWNSGEVVKERKKAKKLTMYTNRKSLIRVIGVLHTIVLCYSGRLTMLVGQCLQILDVWGPDIFHIADVTNNTPLTTVVYTILKVSWSLDNIKYLICAQKESFRTDVTRR